MQIPVNEPMITAEAKKFVVEAMESGWISSAGKYIKEFEEEFARFIGVKHAITTTNGTAALHLALAALGIGPGDEVIVPDFTMMATVDAVLYTGAVPVMVDVDPDTYNLDPTLLEAAITPKTKAIIPVHIYGHSADMDPILSIAAKHGIPVVEDAAEAHGGTYKGKMCGAMGAINAFSFYGNKIITTGEGGMVTTNDDLLAQKARELKDLAHSPQKRFWHEKMGFNYRMTNLQAACGLGQLEHVQEFIAKKAWMAEAYAKGLADIKGMRLPVTKAEVKNVYWMYAVLLTEEFPLTRDELRKKLFERGIDTRDFFYSVSAQPIAAPFRTPGRRFPVTERIAERGLYLPSGLALTQEQVDHVCSAIHAILA
jgi:perosamine synthetase